MLIANLHLTPAVVWWLAQATDDAAHPLVVTEAGERHLCVLRADGAELSATERAEVLALVEANKVEPLRLPPLELDPMRARMPDWSGKPDSRINGGRR